MGRIYSDKVQAHSCDAGFDTSSDGSRERLPAELNKVVELLWFCECDVWSDRRLEDLSLWSRVMNAHAAES